MNRRVKHSVGIRFLAVTLGVIIVGMLLLASAITYLSAFSLIDETLANVT